MGTTLGSGSGLDLDKTLACRTFGDAVTPRLEDGTSHSNDHAARWSRQDAGAISACARVCVTRVGSGPLPSS